MKPSDEAMAAAERLVTTDSEDVYIGGFYGVRCYRSLDPTVYSQKVKKVIATALDDHTADLRREVEALRARVALLGGWESADNPPPMVDVVKAGRVSKMRELLFRGKGWYVRPNAGNGSWEWDDEPYLVVAHRPLSE